MQHVKPSSSTSSSEENISSTSRLSQGTNQVFDIRKNYFICGVTRWNESLTNIVTGTGSFTRNKVLKASECRKDNAVHMKMLSHQDLFAFGAKYLRFCLSDYISERNIIAAVN